MQKIKYFIESERGKDIWVVMIVVLVGLGSFELGRLSKNSDPGCIKINYQNPEGIITANQTANVISSISDQNIKNFFASNRGTKYYTISCSAGKNIKQENRVWFDTREEAEQAGYTLSGSCN